MGDSLKDQLIALGLARADSGKKPKKPARAGGKRKKQGAGGGELSLDQAYRLREREEKASAELKKQQKREQDLLRRQLNARIQALVEAHSLNDKKAELKRNFLYKGRIRSVLVTPEQLKQLNDGTLGVVFLRGSYILMLPEHVEEVRGISPDHVPDLGGDEPGEEEEFPVPDDLIW